MRRIFEWIGGFAIVAFSFYFTDKVSLLVASKSDLMGEIKEVSASYEQSPVDAIIDADNNTIIPGKFGRTVNDQESYLSMHDFGSFNENYLVYDYIKPEKSLEDNKDKYITSGNKINRRVALIVRDNEEVKKFLIQSQVLFDELVKESVDSNENIELINGANSKSEFNAINSKIKGKSKLCLKEESNLDLCKKNGYYMIDPKVKLMGTNILEVKSLLEPGSIILLSSSAKVEDVKLILKELEYKDLSIVHISRLIDEKESVR